MEKKDFKKMFGTIAASKGFTPLQKFWHIESKECIITLELLKSNFGNFYYLSIKIFIKGVFGKKYEINNDLGKAWGDVSRRPPSEYDAFFDLDSNISSQSRQQGLEALFDDFLAPFTEKALFKQGIFKLANDHEVIISDAMKNQLVLNTDAMEYGK